MNETLRCSQWNAIINEITLTFQRISKRKKKYTCEEVALYFCNQPEVWTLPLQIMRKDTKKQNKTKQKKNHNIFCVG